MIKAFLFDLMDTLVSIDQKPKVLVHRLLGFSSADQFDELAVKIALDTPGLAEKDFFDRLAEYRRCDSQVEFHWIRNELKRRWRGAFERASLASGVAETLRDLRSDGYRLAIISNALPPTRRLIEELNLAEFVDHIALSCDVGCWKPSKKIFASAIKGVGSPELSEIVMVGNKISTDMIGAIEFGLRGVLLDASIQCINTLRIGRGAIIGVTPNISQTLPAARLSMLCDYELIQPTLKETMQ